MSVELRRCRGCYYVLCLQVPEHGYPTIDENQPLQREIYPPPPSARHQDQYTYGSASPEATIRVRPPDNQGYMSHPSHDGLGGPKFDSMGDDRSKLYACIYTIVAIHRYHRLSR